MNEPGIPAVEITRASNLADRIESNEKLKKRLVRSVFIILALIFIGFLAWGINSVLLTEGTEILPEDYNASVSASPETGEEAIALFRKLIDEASDKNKTKVSVNTTLNIEDESVTVENDENGLVKKSIIFVKDKMLDNLSKYYDDKSTGFGEPLASLLFPVSFNSSELKTWKTEEDGENRSFVFEFPMMPFDSVSQDIRDGLGMDKADSFKQYVKEKLSPVAEVVEAELTCNSLSISGVENRLNDHLNKITYTRTYGVSTSVRFKGELKSLGERKITFVFTSKTECNFTWAGISLSDSVIWMEKGKTEALEAFRSADDTLEVTWSSSDESVATVDSEGYVRGYKTSPKPVIVTASVKYLGNIYTAECLVYVVIPVKKVELNTRSLSMKPGDTSTLVAEISPDKATVKDVRWFTTDENVATVDSNGIVKAISSGSCEVYLITLNENYKRSCTITVIDEETK